MRKFKVKVKAENMDHVLCKISFLKQSTGELVRTVVKKKLI